MTVEKLKEVVKGWSFKAIMVAIDEELYRAESLEQKVELLAFKCEILQEGTIPGKSRPKYWTKSYTERYPD